MGSFDSFLQTFRQSGPREDTNGGLIDTRWGAVPGYLEFVASVAGMTYDDGLYRTHGTSSAAIGRRALEEAFPAFADRALPFAYDWLGRQFAIDLQRQEAGSPLLLLIEPGSGQVLEIPLNFLAFHDQLHTLREPALAEGFFRSWIRVSASSSLPLGRNLVVGYKIPLFLGGSDDVSNLELTDFDVYWTLTSQLSVTSTDRIRDVRGE